MPEGGSGTPSTPTDDAQGKTRAWIASMLTEDILLHDFHTVIQGNSLSRAVVRLVADVPPRPGGGGCLLAEMQGVFHGDVMILVALTLTSWWCRTGACTDGTVGLDDTQTSMVLGLVKGTLMRQGVRACPESPVALVETVVSLASTLLEEKDACNGLRALMNRTINRQDRVYARAVAEVRAFWIACMQGTRPDVKDPWLQGALARTVEGHARRLAGVTSACLPMSMDHADMVQRAAAALAAPAHSERARDACG